ncbi:glycosyl hydrolase family 8 [Sulfuricurvum sp.]|uniref:glycosyl hydrolase family 8 n=1 Tax=Sulfuricurvum sp. TaxID=2025608 RepID=UPI003565DF55
MFNIARIAIAITFLANIAFADSWDNFKTSYIQPDGRVVDRQNNNITHTEGIGYALFFSVCYNDKETFQKLNHWLENNMPKNEQGLYPWKWGENEKKSWTVLDTNNATDGDMWIAYAWLSASKKFKDEKYRTKALELIQSIQLHLTRTVDNHIFLLPGIQGFETNATITINPSYSIPFIFDAFYIESHNIIWNNLKYDSLALLNMCYSTFHLHADWMIYNKERHTFSLPSMRPYFSYDAIRIPLFWSIWSKLNPGAEVLHYLEGYQNILALPYFPIFVDLVNNTVSLDHDESGAMQNSLLYYSKIFTNTNLSKNEVINEKKTSYYGDSLGLFSTLPLECYRY